MTTPPNGADAPRYVYEWSLLESWADRPAWLAAAAAGVLVVAALTVLLHRRERQAMSAVSATLLLALRFVALAAVVLFLSGVGIYHFEREAQPEAFGSIPQSLWWALATLTTVGYAMSIRSRWRAGSLPALCFWSGLGWWRCLRA